MARRKRLTDAGIARLRPEALEYTVWDTRIAGLGVRVRPSGYRTFVYHRKVGGKVRKTSFGSTAVHRVEEARKAYLEAAAAPVETNTVRPERAPLFRDFVDGPWKAACFDRCTPSTQRELRGILKRQLLPAFGSCRLDRITSLMAIRWFEKYSQTAPGAANQALNLLRRICAHALARGHIGTNPARGIKRNPRAKLTRFLSREEIRRLHRTLDRYAHGSVSEVQQAEIIRLLLLTGCRKSEIVGLRRNEVREDRLELIDSKTGPRTVPLNSEAREILDRRLRPTGSPWVFPSVTDPSRQQARGLRLWYVVRREAGIEDVRLHDLRHTVASQAAMNGVPLPVVARLLGHRNVRMTMRYAHVGDREVEAAAERVGRAVAEIMGMRRSARPDGGASETCTVVTTAG